MKIRVTGILVGITLFITGILLQKQNLITLSVLVLLELL